MSCGSVVLSGCKHPDAAATTNQAAVAPVSTPATQPGPATAAPGPTEPAPIVPIQFTDITKESGLRFKHNSGAYGKKYLPETLGSGCAFIDYDNDGWQDVILVNGTSWPDHEGPKTTLALYHNNHDGTFTNTTKAAGLAIPMYGMGVAVGDFDNDGFDDIFISSFGQNHLFRNLGNGKFSDVTAAAGMTATGFNTSAAWVDFDKDGKLDLFVCNYVEWAIEKDLYCSLDGKEKSYCTPESYKGTTSHLYRNLGGGKFEDVTAKAGLNDPTSKSLGVAIIDYDNDGWPDLFVSNDTQPNKLYRNNGNGTFTENATTAGVAFSEAGTARAGMGVDAADYDGSGHASLIVGNFSNEMLGLFHNDGKGLFQDEAASTGIGQATLLSLTFGLFFYDYDLDGKPDIFLANGHVADDINHVQPKITYAMAPKLFRNEGNKKFEEVSRKVGKTFQRPIVARGAAYADIDNDGDLDLLIMTNNGSAYLFRNDGGNQNHFIRIKTVGSQSNYNGIGAKITLELSDGKTEWAMVKSGSSYCSQSELPVTFGLGPNDKIARIEVTWPSGRTDTLTNVEANQLLVVKEGAGLASATKMPMVVPTPTQTAVGQ